MEISNIRFGLGAAVLVMTTIGLLFALYCKIGQLSHRKVSKNPVKPGSTQNHQ